MIQMLQIGMTVKVLPDAEYSGKYTSYVGVVKNYYSSKKKAGVKLEKAQNDASSKGLFWFSEANLQPIPFQCTVSRTVPLICSTPKGGIGSKAFHICRLWAYQKEGSHYPVSGQGRTLTAWRFHSGSGNFHQASA